MEATIAPNGKSIILFDGVCNLCNHSVQFIIRRDKKGHFYFTSLQSLAGKNLLKNFQSDSDDFDSVVLIEKDRLFTKSTAALKIARQLDGFWPLLYIFFVIPPKLRDGIYDFIARNRYRWFGKREACMVPNPEWKQRFLKD